MIRPIRFILPLALLFAAILFSAGQAQAGTYYVQICGNEAGADQSLGGTGVASLYSGGTIGGLLGIPNSGSNCVAAADGKYYLGAQRTSTQPGANAFRGWQIVAPTGTTINEVVGSLASCRNGTTTRPRFQMVYSGTSTQIFERLNTEGAANAFTIQGYNPGGGACQGSNYASDTNTQYGFRWGTSGTSWWNAPQGQSATNMASSAESLRFYLFCESTCGTSAVPHLAARNLRLLLNDTSNPPAPTVTAGPWSDTAVTTTINTGAGSPAVPVRTSEGTRTPIAAAVTDNGSGAQLSTVRVNDTTLLSQNDCTPLTAAYSESANSVSYTGTYPYGTLSPCPLSTNRSINIPSLTPASTIWQEGLNNVTVATTDYSGNSGAASTAKQLVIDDTAPNVSSTGCLFEGTSGSNGWYTSTPTYCYAQADENFDGGTRAVAGLNADNGLTYTNTMGGGPYSEASLFNQTMLSEPSIYWPLNGSLNDNFGNSNLSGTASSGSSNAGPFQNNTVYTLAAGANLRATTLSSSYDSFSVSAWIRPTSVTSNRSIISQGTGTNSTTPFGFYLASGTLTLVSYNSSGGTLANCTHPTAIPTNKWTHVAATRNSSTGSVRLFVNGSTPFDSCSGTAGNTAANVNSPNISVGGGLPGGDLLGQIAHAAVHRSTLSIDEVRELYSAGCQATGANACAQGGAVGNSTEATALYNPIEGSATVTSVGTDRVGNTASSSGSMKVDTVNPVAQIDFCTGSGSGEGGALVNGWYTSSTVTCTLLGNDVTSKPNSLEWSYKVNDGSFSSYDSLSSPLAFSRVNLLSNPRALINTDSWTNASMNSMSRWPAPALLNDRTATVIRFVSDGANENIYTSGATESGTKYVCSAYVYRLSGGGATYALEAQSASGSTLATSSQTVGSGNSGSWVRLEAPFTQTANENARCAVVQTSAGSATTAYVSEAMLEANVTAAMPFFDGSSPGASWNGAVGNSPSTLADADKRASVPVSNSTNGNEGTIAINGRVTDNAGRSASTSAATTLQVDRNNPSTSVNCTGTTGSNGWFTSQPTCTLSGQDTATGSGVTSLSRSINGGSYSVVASSP